MDWDQLRELIAQGFEIGGHTASHCNMASLDPAALQQEVVQSMQLLESRLDTAIETFAYPYGLFEPSSPPVAECLSNTHCKAAFTTVRRVIDASASRFELPRLRFNREFDFAWAYNLQTALDQTGSTASA